MAYIERSGAQYLVRWREGGRDAPKQQRGAPDLATARKLKQKIEQDLALYGRVTLFDPQAGPEPLAARLEAWIDALKLQVAPRTVTSYSDSAVMFLRYLTLDGTAPETVPVTAMNRDNLNGFQLWLQAQGRTLTTIAKRAQALRLAWEWLHEGTDRAWLDAAPRRIATKKIPAARPVAPTWAEADACLRACLHHDPRAEWLYPFALLARFTGLRRSEILRLKWEHIDIAAGILDVHGQITKGGYSGRRIPVSPHLLAELATLPRDDQWIVPAPEKERIAADGDGRGHVDRNMRRAWARAGVPSAKWSGQPCHAFRKTMRTEMELLDVRREVIDYLIGHQPEGTGARHYLEAERALWPKLVQAVKLIPPLAMDAVATQNTSA